MKLWKRNFPAILKRNAKERGFAGFGATKTLNFLRNLFHFSVQWDLNVERVIGKRSFEAEGIKSRVNTVKSQHNFMKF